MIRIGNLILFEGRAALDAIMILQLFAALCFRRSMLPRRPLVTRKAETLRRYDGAASQGAAVGPNDVYAVSNFRLVRFDKKTGEKRAEWTGDKVRFPHINSCALIAKDLVCASSNFPGVPQVSTVEIFDPMTLAHRRSVSLGLGTGLGHLGRPPRRLLVGDVRQL
jgi:hypothetical protein